MQPALSRKVMPWRSALFLTFIFVMIMLGCRKNQQLPASDPSAMNNLDVNTLKAAYTRDTTTSFTSNFALLHIPNSGGKVSSMLNNLNVRWQTMHVIKRDSSTVIEFELERSSQRWTLDASSTNTRNKNMLVFIQYKSGRQLSFYMKVIANVSTHTDSSIVKNFHYQQAPQGFSGQVMYFNLNRYFLNGWVYQSGKVTAAMAGSTAATTLSLNIAPEAIKKKALTESITVVCYEVYNYNYVVGIADSGSWVDDGYAECYYQLYDDGGGGSSSGSVIVDDDNGNGSTSPPPCNPPGSAEAVLRGGRKITLIAAPPTGGGGGTGTGGGTPCLPVVQVGNPLNPAIVNDLLSKFNMSGLTSAEITNLTIILKRMDATTLGDKVLSAIDAYYVENKDAIKPIITHVIPDGSTNNYESSSNTLNLGDNLSDETIIDQALYNTAHELYHVYETQKGQSPLYSNFELDAYMVGVEVLRESPPENFSHIYETLIEVKSDDTTPLTQAQTDFNSAWDNFLNGNTSPSNYAILDNNFLTGSVVGPNYTQYGYKTGTITTGGVMTNVVTTYYPVTNNPTATPLFFIFLP